MNNLTTLQIAQVFGLYMGSRFTESNGNVSGSGPAYHIVQLYADDYTVDLSPYKLELRPLPAISDEDAIEVAKILDSCDGNGIVVNREEDGKRLRIFDRYNDNALSTYTPTNVLIFYPKSYEIYKRDEGSNLFEYDMTRLTFVHQYLTQQGYAVPLFIAPGHPDNGKTAIELGLAIDSTTLK